MTSIVRASRARVAKLERRWRLVHHAFGWNGLARRTLYLGRLRRGSFNRATPRLPGYQALPPIVWPFSFDVPKISERYRAAGLVDLVSTTVLAEAASLLDGKLRFYGGAAREVGWPPRWHAFPDGSQGPDPSAHWTDVSDDLENDVKDLWEPSRLGFTFLLARAYLVSADERWVEAWWTSLEDWMRANPPNTGVNWRCGQEASLRGIAVSFGMSAFTGANCSTERRMADAGRLLEATRLRVRPAVGYALSQRNNHALSELVFLLSTSTRADRRLEALLREALSDQFYDDGSYSQQSLNYERLAVHTLIWLLHVQPRLEVRTRAAVQRRLASAAAFFGRAADPVTRRLPNSGANDGALLLDLEVGDRADATPTLAMLGSVADRTESACWLPPEDLLLPHAEPAQASSFPSLRGDRCLVFTHVGPSRHRLADDDQQSVEVIVDGEPLILDPGSYRYSGSGVWRQPFVSADVHNSPRSSVDSAAVSIGRFLRDAAPAAELIRWTDDGAYGVIVSRRAVGDGHVTRVVVRAGEACAVVDHPEGVAITCRWLLPSEARGNGDEAVFAVRSGEVRLVGHQTVTTVRRQADEPTSGWWSPHYGELQEATAVDTVTPAGEVSIVFVQPTGADRVSFEQLAEATADLGPVGGALRRALAEAVGV